MATRLIIIGGKVYAETGERLVIVGGKVFRETVAPPATGGKLLLMNRSIANYGGMRQ